MFSERWKQYGRKVWISVAVLCLSLAAIQVCRLLMARGKPVDAMLVLGGTPNRERYAAELAKQHPDWKILISGGSEDPCIWLMFDKARAPKDNVWMERCSKNTLENLMYSTPILRSWHVHHVLLISDLPQAQRSFPMTRVCLGAHGMWCNRILVPGSGGEPLRRPPWMDIALSVLWAMAGQIFFPTCSHFTHLPAVDMHYWYQRGFYCPEQAQLKGYHPSLENH